MSDSHTDKSDSACMYIFVHVCVIGNLQTKWHVFTSWFEKCVLNLIIDQTNSPN